MSTLPKIGSRVLVRFGTQTVEAEVIDAYDNGYGPQVMVSIMLEGSDEPLTPTFDADFVELAA